MDQGFMGLLARFLLFSASRSRMRCSSSLAASSSLATSQGTHNDLSFTIRWVSAPQRSQFGNKVPS